MKAFKYKWSINGDEFTGSFVCADENALCRHIEMNGGRLIEIYEIDGKINVEGIDPVLHSGEQLKLKATKVYRSPNLHFMIDYPASWRVKEEDWMVAFGSPQESDMDDFIENVNVIIEDLSNNSMTLKEYNDLSLMNFPKFLPNFELLQEGTAEIDGKGASFIIYSDRRDDVRAKFKAYTFICNNKAYVVTYAAKENEFNEYLPQAESMMKSIKII